MPTIPRHSKTEYQNIRLCERVRQPASVPSPQVNYALMGGFDYGEAAVLACVEAVRDQISTTLFDEVD
jgi:hypothetical protein